MAQPNNSTQITKAMYLIRSYRLNDATSSDSLAKSNQI